MLATSLTTLLHRLSSFIPSPCSHMPSRPTGGRPICGAGRPSERTTGSRSAVAGSARAHGNRHRQHTHTHCEHTRDRKAQTTVREGWCMCVSIECERGCVTRQSPHFLSFERRSRAADPRTFRPLLSQSTHIPPSCPPVVPLALPVPVRVWLPRSRIRCRRCLQAVPRVRYFTVFVSTPRPWSALIRLAAGRAPCRTSSGYGT